MTTIKLKNGSGAPLAGDLVQGEPALDLTNKRLYTEDSGGTVIEVGTNPTSLTTGTFTSTGIDDNAASTAITIDSSQNVGIGTSSPSNTVTITNGSSGATEANGSIVPLMIENSSSAYINFLTPNNANAGFLFSDPEGNNVGQMQYLHGSDALVFATNASERMRIDSSGNVSVTSGDISVAAGKLLKYSATSYITPENNVSGAEVSTGGTFTVKTGPTPSLAMTVDGSGNMLVGHTSLNGTGGVDIGASGYVRASRSGDEAAIFNRETNDGTIVSLQKDGLQVGSVGTAGGTLQIHGSSGGLFLTSSIEPTNGSSRTDNATDLGSSTYRFKDLYLSGNAYIGGNTAIHSGNIGSQSVSASGVSYRLADTHTIDYNRPGLTWFDLNTPSGSTGLDGTTSYNPSAEGGQDSWYHHLMMTHNNGSGYYTELVAGFHNNELWMHRVQGGVDKGWVEFVHSGNIGTQTVSHAATATSANQIDGLDFFNTSQTNVTTTPEGNGIGYYQSGTNFTGNATDGAIYSQHYSSNWQHKIFGDYRSGMIAVQGKNSGSLQAVKAVPTITVDTAPSFGVNSPGEMWWDTTSGRLKIAVGTSSSDIQWVDASPSGNVETKFDKAGGTLTGPVTMMSQLDVRGTILAVDINASGTVTQASDASLKDDVQVIENAVEKVSQIRGVTFTRNDVEDDSRHAGVIAQEVESVLPEVVSETNGKKSVAYGNMVGLLIEAVKEQQATIDALAKRVEELEGE